MCVSVVFAWRQPYLVIENATKTAALKECWKHRLRVLKKDLGYDDAPMLEQLLIHRLRCWLKLNLVEFGLFGHDEAIDHVDAPHVLGETFECCAETLHSSETLARVRNLSRNTPALQLNIAARGGQQLNFAR